MPFSQNKQTYHVNIDGPLAFSPCLRKKVYKLLYNIFIDLLLCRNFEVANMSLKGVTSKGYTVLYTVGNYFNALKGIFELIQLLK